MTEPLRLTAPEVVHRAAVLSPCGRYRYRLERTWDRALSPVVFVMLNPSTANATIDDPTIRRCVTFARTWGHGGLVVVNLFAWRATSPDDLVAAQRAGHDVVGPDNDAHLVDAARAGACVVAAWGTRGGLAGRDVSVRELLHDTALMWLRATKHAQPEHPLYLPAFLRPTPMEDRRG